MLDRFVYGRVERTSPEAPVPILRTDHDVYMLGGAGNVVRNLVSLGAQATLLSVIGDDEVGRRLTGLVGREERVEPHLLVERGRLSTEKTRFVAGGQQLLRTDSETTDAIAQRSAGVSSASPGMHSRLAMWSCSRITPRACFLPNWCGS